MSRICPLGAAWTGRGRPPAGYFTKRLAEDWLRDTLDQVRRGTLPGLVRTGPTVADAAAEYLRYVEHDRARKPSTVAGYRWIIDGQILPRLGPQNCSKSIRATLFAAARTPFVGVRTRAIRGIGVYRRWFSAAVDD
jgi:hypothetical protein